MRPPWGRTVRIIGGTLAVVCFLISGVLYLFVAGDPVPGTTKHAPGWIVDLGLATSVGFLLGLALFLLTVLAEDWRDPSSWLRRRFGLWKHTGSPFASAAEKARRPRPGTFQP
jgi:hypothetical protein